MRNSLVRIIGSFGFLIGVFICAGCHRAQESKHVEFRQFDSFFSKIRDIHLGELDSRNATALTMDSKGNIYVIDSRTRKIYKFNPDGHFLRTIGKEGWGPGEFIVPWSLACDGKDNLYALDLQAGRISMFDRNGDFKTSIAFASLGFAGVTLKVSTTGDVYVGGMQRPPTPQSPLLYKLGNDGKLLTSFYLQDSLVAKLNLSVVGGVQLDVDPSGDLYSVQPVSTKVSVFSPDGRLIREFGRIPPFYQPPFEFPRKLPKDRAKVQGLLDRWTQLSDIRVLPTEHLLLLTFGTHSPSAYGIEIYRDNGQFVVGEIGSALFPAFTSSGGHVYFYDPAGSKLTLSEFAVVLPPKNGTS